MDTLSQDVWYIICSYLPTYDFVRTRQLAHRYKAWSTEGWIRRAARRLHLNADSDFRAFFSRKQVSIHLQYFDMLVWGRIVEKHSSHVLSLIDCLSFAITMKDVELVSYFAERTLTVKDCDVDLLEVIDHLCNEYRAPACYIECLKRIKTIKDPKKLIYDLPTLVEYKTEDRNTIISHLIRLQMCDSIITRMLAKYIRNGIDVVAQVSKNNRQNFMYCGTLSEIKALTCINDNLKFSFALASSCRRGKIADENFIQSHLQKDLYLANRKFIPHMCRLWSKDEEETKIPEYVKITFPHIYIENIPYVIHACGLCLHFCEDVEHRCNHTVDEQKTEELRSWYLEEEEDDDE